MSKRQRANSGEPALQVVRGAPDAAELAAVIAVLAAAGEDAPAAAPPPVRGRWSDSAVLMPGAWRSGPGAWRAAGR